MKQNKGNLLNKKQLAEYLGLKAYTIDSWVSQRRIPYIKLGKCVRFDPDEIEEWLQRQKVPIRSEENHPFQAKKA